MILAIRGIDRNRARQPVVDTTTPVAPARSARNPLRSELPAGMNAGSDQAAERAKRLDPNGFEILH